ncbi:hypothetical protein EVAR_49445_1 [Eumeta japonica]|uniref:Uncharacterized protein n=1 Tax=Eumeta variegata TaxID=151549 RepID=A0A4C1Y1T3_EUMVA|nr:hypothetical protein EVAR_49445_1 [Eumeta japonica]
MLRVYFPWPSMGSTSSFPLILYWPFCNTEQRITDDCLLFAVSDLGGARAKVWASRSFAALLTALPCRGGIKRVDGNIYA